MKIQEYKSYDCLLLIGAIVVTIIIATSFGNTKTAITDAEMSGVYGGCKWIAASNGRCCAAGFWTGGQCGWPTDEPANCVGHGWSSCKQNKAACRPNETGFDNCDPYEIDCYNTWQNIFCWWDPAESTCKTAYGPVLACTDSCWTVQLSDD